MGDVKQQLPHPGSWSPVKVAYGISGDKQHVQVYRASAGGAGQLLYSGAMDPDNASWRKVLQDIHAEQGTGQAWVSATLPAASCILRWLETPLKSRSKAAKVLPGLLDIEIPFKLKDFRYSFLQLAPGKGGAYSALATAARDRDIEARCTQLAEASVEADMVDAEALALWQAHRSRLGDQPSLLIDLDAQRSLLAVADKERLHFQLLTASGAGDLAERPEQFIRALQRGLLALPENYQELGQAYVSGALSGLPVKDRLQKAFEGGVQIECFTEDKASIAQGLAERALCCEDSGLNFLLADESPRLQAAAQGSLLRWALAAAICGVALIVGAKVWQAEVDQRIAGYQNRITETAAQLAGQTPAQMKAYRGQEVLIASRAVEARGESRSVFEGAVSDGLLPSLSSLLATAKQFDLDILQLRLDRQQLMIEGSAPDWDVCENLLAEGQRQGYSLKLHRDRANQAERIPFSLVNSEAGR